MSLFKKTDEIDNSGRASSPPVEQTRGARSKSVSVIGPTLVFKGELSADEDLIIEGQIEGTIAHHKKHLTVGKQGRVKADIHARSVIVLGQLVGNIHSEGMVSLAKSANVKGDIFCARIAMEDGARFEGSLEMGAPPKIKAVPADPSTSDPVPLNKPRTGAGQS